MQSIFEIILQPYCRLFLKSTRGKILCLNQKIMDSLSFFVNYVKSDDFRVFKQENTTPLFLSGKIGISVDTMLCAATEELPHALYRD